MSMISRQIETGHKNFEVRVDDRGYMPGDFLALNEWKDGKYTGRCMLHEITCVLSDSEYCKEGYVVLGIAPCLVTDTSFSGNRIKAKIYDRG